MCILNVASKTLLIIIAISVHCSEVVAEPRAWMHNGKRLVAEYISHDNEKATLRKSGGQIIKVSVSLLSNWDRMFLERQDAQGSNSRFMYRYPGQPPTSRKNPSFEGPSKTKRGFSQRFPRSTAADSRQYKGVSPKPDTTPRWVKGKIDFPPNQRTRRWMDPQGKLLFKAKAVSMRDGNTAVVVTDNRKTVTIAVAKLCKVDRYYLDELCWKRFAESFVEKGRSWKFKSQRYLDGFVTDFSKDMLVLRNGKSRGVYPLDMFTENEQCIIRRMSIDDFKASRAGNHTRMLRQVEAERIAQEKRMREKEKLALEEKRKENEKRRIRAAFKIAGAVGADWYSNITEDSAKDDSLSGFDRGSLGVASVVGNRIRNALISSAISDVFPELERDQVKIMTTVIGLVVDNMGKDYSEKKLAEDVAKESMKSKLLQEDPSLAGNILVIEFLYDVCDAIYRK